MSSAYLCRRRAISWKTTATTMVSDIQQKVSFSSAFIDLNTVLFFAAVKMHEKNLEMKHLREDMEKKMRDQLVTCIFASNLFPHCLHSPIPFPHTVNTPQNKMDISYQKDAFAALSERHKKAMFQNAKLKDEVALQGVGLNNLGSRLAKQTQQHDVCNRELKTMNKRVSYLSNRFVFVPHSFCDCVHMRFHSVAGIEGKTGCNIQPEN